MHLFHFGSAKKRLLGAYHAAAGASRAGGVVLCHPFGHEYIRAHRAMRNLAVHLSHAGHDVLRFDYFGCGDSSGEGQDGSIAQWVEDIATAIDELKDMASVTRVSLVGLRLGASLAALAATTRKDVGTLVLWDPVVSGSQYLDELAGTQAEWLRSRPHPAGFLSVDPPVELIGFPVTPALRGELQQLDLRAMERWPARRNALLYTQGVDADGLAESIAQRGGATIQALSADDCRWRRPDAVHLQLLAADAARVVAGFFEKGP